MTVPKKRTSSANLFPNIQIDGTFLVDIWDSYNLSLEFVEEEQLFITHKVTQYERWDQIAEEYYQDRTLWWILLMTNQVEDPFALYVDSIIPTSLETLKILKPARALELANLVRESRIQKDYEFNKKLKRDEETT